MFINEVCYNDSIAVNQNLYRDSVFLIENSYREPKEAFVVYEEDYIITEESINTYLDIGYLILDLDYIFPMEEVMIEEMSEMFRTIISLNDSQELVF